MSETILKPVVLDETAKLMLSALSESNAIQHDTKKLLQSLGASLGADGALVQKLVLMNEALGTLEQNQFNVYQTLDKINSSIKNIGSLGSGSGGDSGESIGTVPIHIVYMKYDESYGYAIDLDHYGEDTIAETVYDGITDALADGKLPVMRIVSELPSSDGLRTYYNVHFIAYSESAYTPNGSTLIKHLFNTDKNCPDSMIGSISVDFIQKTITRNAGAYVAENCRSILVYAGYLKSSIEKSVAANIVDTIEREKATLLFAQSLAQHYSEV